LKAAGIRVPFAFKIQIYGVKLSTNDEHWLSLPIRYIVAILNYKLYTGHLGNSVNSVQILATNNQVFSLNTYKIITSYVCLFYYPSLGFSHSFFYRNLILTGILQKTYKNTFKAFKKGGLFVIF